MRVASISSAALWEAGRRSTDLLRTRLAEAREELSSGRLADAGRALGFRTEASIALRLERGERTTTVEAIGLARARVGVLQSQLEGFRTAAEAMLDTLGPARGVSVNRQMISAQAVASMTALVDGLATTFDGAVVFGGEQTALPPLDDYYADPPPPSRVAVRDAFLTRFGFGIDDPQAAGITPAQMDAFLDQAFLPLFSSPQWEDLWSNASTQAIVTRVSKNQVVPTSITANAQPFRDLAAAYTMMSDIGGAALNEGAYQRIVDRSLALSARAATGLAYQAAEIGTSEQLMKAATTRHETEIGLIDKRINEMESVDPFESASRAKALMDQLEVSYALTARIQNLSLVRFL